MFGTYASSLISLLQIILISYENEFYRKNTFLVQSAIFILGILSQVFTVLALHASYGTIYKYFAIFHNFCIRLCKTNIQ